MTVGCSRKLVLLAAGISLSLHLGLMLFVRSKVMTRGARLELSAARREPIRVRDFTPPTDPVRMERILDILAPKAAPKADAEETRLPTAPTGEAELLVRAEFVAKPAEDLPAVPVSSPLALPAPSASSLSRPSAPPIELTVPNTRVLAAPAPNPTAVPLATARFGVPTPKAGPEAPIFLGKTERFGGTSAQTQRFEPRHEVTKEVDEHLVETEKSAVRALLGNSAAADLGSAVELVTTVAEDEEWVYFQTRFSARSALEVVPKDVVILLDASGSLGSDRLVSCRLAAKRILRSAMNSGDRFNLVAFRNRFDYAFVRWQDCTATSFGQADRWLANLTSHGRTDVFATIRSVLTLPRDPTRPLIALVVTDGDANSGVSETAEILSKFTALNDGLVSVYMYGVNRGANRELIDVLTHGNRGESFVFDGFAPWRAGSALESLSERFRDPVLSDLRLVFTSESRAETYPRLLKNLYRGDSVTVTGRVPKGTKSASCSLRGLNGARAYEGIFVLDLEKAATDPEVKAAWATERALDGKLR